MTDVTLGPATVNLLGVIENDAWSIALTLTSGDDPYNLTGATISAKLKTPTQKYSMAVLVTDAVAGKLTISQNSAPAIAAGSKWALRINHRTMLSGKVTGIPDVLT